MKKYICLFLTLGWIGLIFSFSLQPAEGSSEVSSGILRTLMEMVFPGLLEKVNPEQWEWLHFLLRKCAHFAEFAVLGVLSMLTARQLATRRERLWALGFCVLVACVDELIQLTSYGRAGRVSDVILDSVGALTGVVAVWWVQRRRG